MAVRWQLAFATGTTLVPGTVVPPLTSMQGSPYVRQADQLFLSVTQVGTPALFTTSPAAGGEYIRPLSAIITGGPFVQAMRKRPDTTPVQVVHCNAAGVLSAVNIPAAYPDSVQRVVSSLLDGFVYLTPQGLFFFALEDLLAQDAVGKDASTLPSYTTLFNMGANGLGQNGLDNPSFIYKNVFYCLVRQANALNSPYRVFTYDFGASKALLGPVTDLFTTHSLQFHTIGGLQPYEDSAGVVKMLVLTTPSVGGTTTKTLSTLLEMDPATGISANRLELEVPPAFQNVTDGTIPAATQALSAGVTPVLSYKTFTTMAFAGLDAGGRQTYHVYPAQLSSFRLKRADSLDQARGDLSYPPWFGVVTADDDTPRSGPTSPTEPALPGKPDGDPPLEGLDPSLFEFANDSDVGGFPPDFFKPAQAGSRDLPSGFSVWIPAQGKWTSLTFNTLNQIKWGGHGRVSGLVATPNGAGTILTLSVPGCFVVNGIFVYYPASFGAITVAVGGATPRALTATQPDASSTNNVTFAVEPYNPVALANKAILATTDSTGAIWTPTPPLNITEIAQLAAKKQLTDEELRLLTAQDGNIDPADILHAHRGYLRGLDGIAAMAKVFNYDFNQYPHTPLPRPVVSADEYHTHSNILTDNEVDDLTARGGIGSADNQHTHKNLPSDAAFAAVFGGPFADADQYHTHPHLVSDHGNVINSNPAIHYVPQNNGNGVATIDARTSIFTGSVRLILGESSSGSGVNRILGIRYKAFARFMYSTTTAAIGGNTAVGLPVEEITETFGPLNPSGVLAAVPFGQEFTWKGIKFKVTFPAVGPKPFTLPTLSDVDGDFFTYHGVVAQTAALAGDGLPQCSPLPQSGAQDGAVIMHERMLSRAALRLAAVLDERFPEGGFFTMVYI